MFFFLFEMLQSQPSFSEAFFWILHIYPHSPKHLWDTIVLRSQPAFSNTSPEHYKVSPHFPKPLWNAMHISWTLHTQILFSDGISEYCTTLHYAITTKLLQTSGVLQNHCGISDYYSRDFQCRSVDVYVYCFMWGCQHRSFRKIDVSLDVTVVLQKSEVFYVILQSSVIICVVKLHCNLELFREWELTSENAEKLRECGEASDNDNWLWRMLFGFGEWELT